MLCGVAPVIAATVLTTVAIWPLTVALRVVAFDAAAAMLLLELALANWTSVPCATVHATASEALKSRWPLQVLGLYVFAFRGADVAMLALGHEHGVTIAVAAMATAIIGLRMRQAVTSRSLEPALDPVSDDRLLLLSLSESDA